MPRGAPRWTNDAQLAFLEARVERFIQGQSNHKELSHFWSDLHAQWFTEFPEEKVVLGEDAPAVKMLSQDDQVKVQNAIKNRKAVGQSLFTINAHSMLIYRKQQLNTWFYNNTNKNRNVSKAISPAVAELLHRPAQRAMRKTDAFSKLFYATLVKPQVDELIAGKNLDNTERLRIVKTQIRTAYDAALPEVIAQVEAEVERTKAACALKREPENAPDLDDLQLYVYNFDPHASLIAQCLCRVQQQLPMMIRDLLEELMRISGWSWSIMGGGPAADADGKIKSIRLVIDLEWSTRTHWAT